MSWLAGWNTRKSKLVDGSTAGVQTNYQMMLTVYKTTGVDTATNVYLGTNVRDDFGDVRFTKSDGSSLLNYWIESYTSGVSANIWVQIDSIPASPGTSTIYIYYSNPLQTTTSNGDNTFVFFDNFDSGSTPDISKWTTNGTPTISGGELVLNSTNEAVRSINTFGTNNKSLRIKINTAPSGADGWAFSDNAVGHHPAGFGASNYVDIQLFTDGHIYTDTAKATVIEELDAGANTPGYAIYEEKWGVSSALFYRNDSLIESHLTTTTIPVIPLYVNLFRGSTGDILVDWVFVRNYVSPEPTFGSSGPEDSWLAGWNIRKSKLVNGSTAGIQTNYQMMLTVYKSTGTDTATNVYLGTNVRDDFGDVRFTKSDGTSLLNYWIESYISGVSANIWVQIDSVPASPGTSTIYIYYDNLSQTTTSNGDNTFLFYDNFPGSSLDAIKWPTTTGSYSVADSVLTVNSQNGYVRTLANYGVNTCVRSSCYISTSGDGGKGYVGYADGTGCPHAGCTTNLASLYSYHISYTAGNCATAAVNISSWTEDAITYPTSRSTYQIYEVRRISTTSVTYYQNTDLLDTITTNVPTISLPIVCGTNNNGTTYYDWVLARNYVSPEPTWGASGPEETNIFIHYFKHKIEYGDSAIKLSNTRIKVT